MRAKKSFGQHFLRHPEIAARIAQSLGDPRAEGRVLEVGPGMGILTQYLADRGPDFLAVDADPDMVAYLASAHPDWKSRILLEDFLRLDLSTIFEGRPFALIGNFPYNISSQILFRMLDQRERIPEMVGMFQREVARRIVSGPGTKDYGILSVLTQAWYDGEYLFSVSRESFNPPPKVQSGVIRLRRKTGPGPDCREESLVLTVKTAFGQRRKMLRNSLRLICPDPDILQDDLYTRRPEQLHLEEFVAITRQLFPSA